ncbi:ElyC/SanA/YdcF family protein [Coleofasciculus sp. E1-EBD-02]|uniref:ElyC/SanA/YdcF family protein n=1 Tax=Coleofasciculus sp. E1-EBD-02 TaxID=3068481 RepID=UPI0032F152CF
MKVGIVCGYGSHLDNQLKRYVNSVMEYALKNEINYLIFSGGYTFKDSTTSEAMLMSSLIDQPTQAINIVLEERALTTLHNLLYAQEIIEFFKFNQYELYIFCDQVRFVKVYILSKLIFNETKVNLIKFRRQEALLAYIMQIPSIFYQGLGAVSPSWEKKLLIAKQKWINKYR